MMQVSAMCVRAGVELASLPLVSVPVNQFLNGVVLGMIFILIALGLSIIFGMMGVINFAHGDILLVGTYVSLAVYLETGSLVLGAIASAFAAGFLGVVIERFGIRLLYGKDPLLSLLITFGIAEILREGVQVIWGRTGRHYPIPSWGEGQLTVGFVSYPRYRILMIVMTIAILVVVYYILFRTDVGLIIRAGTEDREMTNALGINIERTYLIVFVFGCVLAGVAGAIIGPIRGAYPLLGIDLLIPAFVVVVVGGVGSVRGTIIAGLLIGQVYVFSGVLDSRISQISILLAMALILLVRPRGLMGREGVIE